jgi:hypothetical protein
MLVPENGNFFIIFNSMYVCGIVHFDSNFSLRIKLMFALFYTIIIVFFSVPSCHFSVTNSCPSYFSSFYSTLNQDIVRVCVCFLCASVCEFRNTPPTSFKTG